MTGRVLITDDHPLTREGLAIAVRLAMPGMAVDAAGSVVEAEALIERHKRYRLILLDLLLPDANGFSGQLRVQFAAPDSPLVVITSREDHRLVDIAASLGAMGYLKKSDPLDHLAGQIRRIAAGERCFPAFDAKPDAAAIRTRISTLSDAQRRVLFAIADGAANKQVAATLGITEATVKAHMTAIFRHLGVSNRAQALIALQPLLGDIQTDQP